MYRILDPCILSCESRVVHLLCLLHAQVLYFKCRCVASVVIIEDISYMHTLGQHKLLSLAREERDPPNKVPDRILKVPDPACSGTN